MTLEKLQKNKENYGAGYLYTNYFVGRNIPDLKKRGVSFVDNAFCFIPYHFQEL